MKDVGRSRRTRVAVTALLGLLLCTACGSSATAVMDASQLRDDVIELGIGDCHGNHRVTVEEATDEVVVEVRTRRRLRVGAQSACMDSVRAELESPLGDRRMVDAATGRQVDVRPGP